MIEGSGKAPYEGPIRIIQARNRQTPPIDGMVQSWMSAKSRALLKDMSKSSNISMKVILDELIEKAHAEALEAGSRVGPNDVLDSANEADG